jgi:hypothetical protein
MEMAPVKYASRYAAAVLALLTAGCAAAGVRAGAADTPALRFVSYLAPGYGAEFSYDEAGRGGTARTDAFGQDSGEVAPHSLWVPLAEGEPVEVEVRLLDDARTPLASGWVQIPQAERDWFYEVQVAVIRYDPRIPRPPCMGCSGEVRFPVRPGGALTAGDSLVVTWSGRHAHLPMPPS